MAEKLHQLLYVSSATENFDDNDLVIILEKARKNNEALNITGMLLYHEGSFIQVLTGPKNAVEKLYSKIEKDDRHNQSRILLKHDVNNRQFENWTMGFYNTNSNITKKIPGLNTFLENGFDNIEGNRVLEVLTGFREGRWRQAVNT